MSDEMPPDSKGEAAAAAFARVLEAEQAAEEAVFKCQEEAGRRLAEARAGERRLTESAAARVLVWRTRLNQAAAAQIAELDQLAARVAAPVALDAAAQERVARAVARLADELIAGD
jgi:vacuolar-type H+-ATPase subunit H